MQSPTGAQNRIVRNLETSCDTMPTIILLDVSLSMWRLVLVNETDQQPLKSLAISGLTTLLDYVGQNCKLEYTSLMVFSRLWQIVCPFTRDFEQIKAQLQDIELFDKTKFINALRGVVDMVQQEWGSEMPCQVILVTDGNAAINAHLMANSNGGRAEEMAEEDMDETNWPLPFAFPSKLHIVCLTPPNEPSFQTSLPFFRKLIELNSKSKIREPIAINQMYSGGQIWVPESNILSYKAVQNLFLKIAETSYQPFKGRLHCGQLSSPIALYPKPNNYTQMNDFDVVRAEISPDITICGFMEISEVSSPAVHSRHLVIPLQENKEEVKKYVSAMVSNPSNPSDFGALDMEDMVSTMCSDEGRQPSFCVLLHGSLKVEGMVAICQVGSPDWYGMLYSWADSKKKSNLMLSTFKCGPTTIPWLGDIRCLGFPSLSIPQTQEEINRISSKKSFSQGCVVWLKQSALQSDIQKILRHARKLPEKTPHFYKELNRLRRAALSFGFYGLIEGLASILERECRMLPGSAHPEAALQLTHAVNCLRLPRDSDAYNQHIVPLETKFTT